MKIIKKKTAKQMVRLGSETAKAGFRNETDVISKLNNWQHDTTAQEWLKAMNYDCKEIECVKASKVIGHYKADVQVRITITIKLNSQEDLQNLQVKLVSKERGFNQIDKRWLDKYVEMWDIPKDVTKILKQFTGEEKSKLKNLKNPRRVFFYEFSLADQAKIINFITENKILIVSDILKGRGEFSADWTLVISKSNSKWTLKSINQVMNIFGAGDVKMSPRGSIMIGKITMQRKGGDGGRPTANMLQFKINPLELFD